jgi:hypothetical protein
VLAEYSVNYNMRGRTGRCSCTHHAQDPPSRIADTSDPASTHLGGLINEYEPAA